MRMRDLLEIEHPEEISDDYLGGCYGCPTGWGYEFYNSKCDHSKGACTACWNRELQPEVVEKVMVNAARRIAILCDQFKKCEDCPLWNGEECKLLAEEVEVASDWIKIFDRRKPSYIQPPVVYCKDCVYSEEDPERTGELKCKLNGIKHLDPNGYCTKGGEKDGKTD